jgi:hypothetical protein
MLYTYISIVCLLIRRLIDSHHTYTKSTCRCAVQILREANDLLDTYNSKHGETAAKLQGKMEGGEGDTGAPASDTSGGGHQMKDLVIGMAKDIEGERIRLLARRILIECTLPLPPPIGCNIGSLVYHSCPGCRVCRFMEGVERRTGF